MKCPHYKICVSDKLLCFDSSCKLNIIENKKADDKRMEEVREALDIYKKSLGIESFLDLNKKEY